MSHKSGNLEETVSNDIAINQIISNNSKYMDVCFIASPNVT